MKPRQYTKDVLEEVVRSSSSIKDVLDYFGLKSTGGNYRAMAQRFAKFGISTNHFSGSAWNKGLNKQTDPRLFKISMGRRTPSSQVFVKDSTFVSSRLGKRMVEEGFEYRCFECGVVDWRGKPLVLHADHVNGDCSDNRIENLRFLCPNCHQQTPTWGNKKSA